MNRQQQREQLARMQKKFDSFPDFVIVPPRTKYVGLNNDGEVELEEIDYNEEEVYP